MPLKKLNPTAKVKVIYDERIFSDGIAIFVQVKDARSGMKRYMHIQYELVNYDDDQTFLSGTLSEKSLGGYTKVARLISEQLAQKTTQERRELNQKSSHYN